MTRKLYICMAALVVFGMITAAGADDEEPSDIAQVSTTNISVQFASMREELEQLRARQSEVDAPPRACM